MPDTPETVLKPPIGYSKLPDGVRCRCIKLWQDAKGAFYCCRSGTPSSATPEVSELVEELKKLGEWWGDEESERHAQTVAKAATALETLEARVKVLESALAQVHVDVLTTLGAVRDNMPTEAVEIFQRIANDAMAAALLKQLSGDGE